MLRINNEEFKGELTEEKLASIIAEIKKLPEPELVSNDVSDIKAEETILCLEQELASVDTSNINSKVKYIGTKDVSTCILMYIYSEQDHLAVHISDNAILNLMPILTQLKDKNLKVTWVGGTPSNPEVSNDNLITLIDVLHEATEILGINFTFISQKFLEKNAFIADAKYQFIFDQILYKTNIICRQLFNAIDNDAFKDYSAKNLRVKNNIVFDDLILNIFLAQELYDTQLESHQMAEQKVRFFKETYTNVSDFINAIKASLTAQGFERMDHYFQEHDLYPESQMQNFVFELATQKMYVINKNLKTPHEEMRLARMMISDDYFLCYFGRTNKWFAPTLPIEILKKCEKINAEVINNNGSQIKIAHLIGSDTYDDYTINNAVKISRDIIKLSKNDAHNANTLFNSGGKPQTAKELSFTPQNRLATKTPRSPK